MRTRAKFGARIRPGQLALSGLPARRRAPKLPEAFVGGRLLTTDAAADYLSIPMATLKFWRRRRERRGPRYIKVHRRAVRYRVIDLDRFLEARTVGPARERPRRNFPPPLER